MFLSPDNPDNDRISCQNSLLNNFDLSPWVEIENNDIRISEDEISTEKPKRKTTTTKPTSRKPAKGSSKLTQNKTENVTSAEKDGDEIDFKVTELFENTTTTNKTLTIDNNETKRTITENVTKPTTVKIDDKLDFKNKSKRFDDITFTDRINSRQNSKSKYDEYDYDDEEGDTQSVQSLHINNLQKRPYHSHNQNRPVITVTENIEKYTYLINYVPRPTLSWRQTTRRPTTRRPEKDVVKVTYQNYADTYRRPNPYYYNQRDNTKDNYRYDNPLTTDVQHSSARSNDQQTTVKTKQTDNEKTDSTTENLYKLITFGYVGSYRGDIPEKTKDKVSLDTNIANDKNEVKRDAISKEFVTFDNTETRDNVENAKLSTFYLYETATKPSLNSNRPTRLNDEVIPTKKTNSKYYYVKNVLHKYPDDPDAPKPIIQITELKGHIKKPIETKKIDEKSNNTVKYDNNIEERSSGKIDIGAVEEKTKRNQTPSKLRANLKRPASTVKTPSVAFQVIPSESR